MERENELTNLGFVGDLIGVNGKIIELTDFDKELNNIPVNARAVFLVNADNQTILCARISKALNESIKSLDEINKQMVVTNKKGENYITGLSKLFTL
jgi:hypothetical protein